MSFLTSHQFTVYHYWVYHYCGQMVGAAYNGHAHTFFNVPPGWSVPDYSTPATKCGRCGNLLLVKNCSKQEYPVGTELLYYSMDRSICRWVRVTVPDKDYPSHYRVVMLDGDEAGTVFHCAKMYLHKPTPEDIAARHLAKSVGANP